MKKKLLYTILLFPLSLFSMEKAPKDIIKPFLTGALIPHEKNHPVINAFESSKKSLDNGSYFAQRFNALPQELQDQISFLASRERARHVPQLEKIGQLREADEPKFTRIFKIDNRTLLGVQQIDGYTLKLTYLRKTNHENCPWVKTIQREDESEEITIPFSDADTGGSDSENYSRWDSFHSCLTSALDSIRKVEFFQGANILAVHSGVKTFLYSIKDEGIELLQAFFPPLYTLAISQDGSTLVHTTLYRSTDEDTDEVEDEECLTFHIQQKDQTYGEGTETEIDEGPSEIKYKSLFFCSNQLYAKINNKRYKIKSVPSDDSTPRCSVTEILLDSEENIVDRHANDIFNGHALPYSLTDTKGTSHSIKMTNFLEKIGLGDSFNKDGLLSVHLFDMITKKNLSKIANFVNQREYLRWRESLEWIDKDVLIFNDGRVCLSTLTIDSEAYEEYIKQFKGQCLARKLKSEYPKTAPNQFESKEWRLKEKLKCIDQVLINAGHKHPKVAAFLAEAPGWALLLGGLGLHCKFVYELVRRDTELTSCERWILCSKGLLCGIGLPCLGSRYEEYILPKLTRYYT